jgi:hypothetical protein
MNRAALEKPFPEDLIKTRKGAFGKDLSFVEAVHYIRRLNDAFDSGWTWKIVSHEINGSEVIVHGVLEGGGQAKHAFGGSTITTNKTTGEVISVSDDLKAAATDALKKACSLFGIGLELYGTAGGESDQHAARSQEPDRQRNPPDERQAVRPCTGISEPKRRLELHRPSQGCLANERRRVQRHAPRVGEPSEYVPDVSRAVSTAIRGEPPTKPPVRRSRLR